MTLNLKNGGTVTVLPSGVIEYRQKGRVFRTVANGNYAESVALVRRSAYGPDARYAVGQ